MCKDVCVNENRIFGINSKNNRKPRSLLSRKSDFQVIIIYLFIYVYAKNIQTILCIYYDETNTSHYLIAALSYFLILHPNSRLAIQQYLIVNRNFPISKSEICIIYVYNRCNTASIYIKWTQVYISYREYFCIHSKNKNTGGEKKNDVARNNYHDKTFQNHIKTYPSFLNYISIINNEETNYIAIINWNTRNNFLFGLDPSFTLDSEYRNSTI